MICNSNISGAMTIQLEEVFNQLPQIPPMPEFIKGTRRAPTREFTLTQKETELALKNALRYIPENGTQNWHLNFWTNCSPPAGFTDTVSDRKER